MTVVVSDTSPIRALAHLQLLDVLARLFDEVLVPQTVAEELLHPPHRFRSVEAIALAEEIRAEAILIDEGGGAELPDTPNA